MKEVTEKIGSGKTPKGGSSVYSDKGIPLLRSQNIYNDRVNFNDIVYITKDIDGGMANSRVLKNDVLLNITGASIGRSAVYIKEHPANVNQHVCIIRPKNSVDSFFIQLNITSTKGQKEIELNQAGGGREGLNFQQIAKMTFFFPKKEEQAEIGAFFKQLDETTALHQRKLELLKQLKQACLQQMFPKKNEKIPELRFVGFEDDWEQRKLGELATFSKGKGYAKNDLTEKGSPIVLYGRLYTKYETVIINVDTFVEMRDNSVISKGEEVIVPASGETAKDISRASVVGTEGIILGGDLNIIKPERKIDSTFLALTISNGTQQKEMTKRAQGKSVVHLHNSDLKQVNLLYPNLVEQKK
ncbi:restriction endonuclease subunit S [Enterococcus hailinensis]|uniref:restriction endonuclease subunit S n=1 Tax=Enterococcus hailinensis TaxID=3238988 RepID=UPI0038B239A6